MLSCAIPLSVTKLRWQAELGAAELAAPSLAPDRLRLALIPHARAMQAWT